MNSPELYNQSADSSKKNILGKDLGELKDESKAPTLNVNTNVSFQSQQSGSVKEQGSSVAPGTPLVKREMSTPTSSSGTPAIPLVKREVSASTSSSGTPGTPLVKREVSAPTSSSGTPGTPLVKREVSAPTSSSGTPGTPLVKREVSAPTSSSGTPGTPLVKREVSAPTGPSGTPATPLVKREVSAPTSSSGTPGTPLVKREVSAPTSSSGTPGTPLVKREMSAPTSSSGDSATPLVKREVSAPTGPSGTPATPLVKREVSAPTSSSGMPGTPLVKREMSAPTSSSGTPATPLVKREMSAPTSSSGSAGEAPPLAQGATSVAPNGGDADNSTIIKRVTGESVSDDKDAKKKHLGQKLIDKGLISSDQLDAVLKEQNTQKKLGNKKMLGSLLIEMGLLTESALGEVLSESFGIKSFDIKKAVLDSNLIKKLPKEVALRHKGIPVSEEGDQIKIAITDVYNILAIDQIRKYFPSNCNIVPVYSAESDLLEVIDQYYGYETSVKGILKEIETGISKTKKQINGEQEGYINPTVRLVDAILVDAIKKGASDIHFEPEAAFIRLRYRIDGKLIQIRSFHKDYWSAIVVRIKILSGMNIAEVRNPQDGRASYSVLGRDIDFRVATHPSVFGENIVMRILDKQKALMPMEKLGLSDNNDKLLRKLLQRPEGIIVVTGPTGSGKTTTLYSILNYINSVDVNIMTLEDPVEYQLPMLRQSSIKESAGMGFASGMKSLLRQDPDIIFVGEVRDESTATMAMRAAMTGHKVFTSLHTNDAISSINRLVDIGVKPHLIAGTLICVLAQRLVRRLCPDCKKSRHANEKETKILGADPSTAPIIYQPVGCDNCFNGYKGRVGVHEILPIDKKMDELIAISSTRENILTQAKKAGFIPISEDGIGKVKLGLTTLEEVAKAADLSDYM